MSVCVFMPSRAYVSVYPGWWCSAAVRLARGSVLVCRLKCDSARRLSLSLTRLRAPRPECPRRAASRSCGTRLISSVIKINEVLIAAVIHANDCGTEDEDFLSLLQSEGESGI